MNSEDQVLRNDEKVIPATWNEILNRAVDLYDGNASIGKLTKEMVVLMAKKMKGES